MNAITNIVFDVTQRIAAPLLRISLAVILVWIGALKFADPSPVVGLLAASLPFLASSFFVYLLGVLEVIAGGLLFANKGVRYVGLLCVALFAGTLTIFVITPAVTYGEAGFPFLMLVGQFLLKDLVLAAASISIAATDAAKQVRSMEMPREAISGVHMA